MYSFPPYRSTVYIMGVLLGYGLRKYKGLQISDTHLRLGWLIAIACYLMSTFGPAPMGRIDYEYNSTHAAIYAAFAPIAWCLFFGWAVFVSHLGYTSRSLELLLKQIIYKIFSQINSPTFFHGKASKSLPNSRILCTWLSSQFSFSMLVEEGMCIITIISSSKWWVNRILLRVQI